MRQIRDLYNEDSETSDVNPSRPDFSSLSAALLPLRGPHRTGQLEAFRAMLAGTPIKDQHGPGRDALYATDAMPGLGPYVGLAHGYGQNIRTQFHKRAPEPAKRVHVPKLLTLYGYPYGMLMPTGIGVRHAG
jgi:hypothetical protein